MLVIDSCDIRSNSGVGIGVEGAMLQVLDSSIHDCERHGVAAYGGFEGAQQFHGSNSTARASGAQLLTPPPFGARRGPPLLHAGLQRQQEQAPFLHFDVLASTAPHAAPHPYPQAPPAAASCRAATSAATRRAAWWCATAATRCCAQTRSLATRSLASRCW